MCIDKSTNLTNYSSSQVFKTLTKTRYLDVLFLLLGLEKPLFALCIFHLCAVTRPIVAWPKVIGLICTSRRGDNQSLADVPILHQMSNVDDIPQRDPAQVAASNAGKSPSNIWFAPAV